MMKPIAILISTFALLASIQTSAADRPNILLIMSDDMGYSDIGCFGGEIETPNLDALAAGGIRFSQFYNTSRCCPTRASLLTGLYQHQAGVGHMTGDNGLPGYRGDLSKETPTIAEALKPAGYRAYMAGKWHVTKHVNPDGPKDNWPLQRGFDRFYGTIIGAGSFFDPYTLCRGSTYITPENDPVYKPETYYYTDAITDNAIEYLKQHKDTGGEAPFFIYVSYTAAHWPLHALPKDIAKYDGRYDGGYAPTAAARRAKMKALGLWNEEWKPAPLVAGWERVENKEREAALMEVYAAMVDRMDQGIGRLMAALKAVGESENTLILYLQDNGACAEDLGWAPMDPKARYEPFSRNDLQTKIWPPMQTRSGEIVRTGPEVMPGPEDTYLAYCEPWANVSNTPFRLYKHWSHEGGISSPLIAHWPKGINVNYLGTRTGSFSRGAKGGPICHDPTHLTDIMATALDLAETKLDSKLQPEGVSLSKVFKGGALDRSNPIFFEHEGNRAVRDGRWKLVARGVNGPWELYNMANDRTETRNLAEEHPDRVKKMSDAYDAWAKRCNVVPFGSWNRKK